jgi:anti-anti-sigma regulatory factor
VVFHPGVRIRHRHGAVETTSRERVGSESVSSGVLVAIVKAGGYIDAYRADAFGDQLNEAIDAGASRLLVDLSQAEELTTAAINALLAARQQLIGREGRIAVVLPYRLRRRFLCLQLDRRFLLASNRQEAAELLGVAAGGDINEDLASHAQAA